MKWLAYFRPGDWLTVTLGAALTLWLASQLWRNDAAHTVLIRAGGQLFLQAPLNQAQRIRVPGPLGDSLIEIQPGRARIVADPSPRQLCVKQGWLIHAGDAALCLPNQLSVELIGAARRFDSLSY